MDECPICYEEMTSSPDGDNKHKEKILSCDHKICQVCYNRILFNNEGKKLCPFCRIVLEYRYLPRRRHTQRELSQTEFYNENCSIFIKTMCICLACVGLFITLIIFYIGASKNLI